MAETQGKSTAPAGSPSITEQLKRFGSLLGAYRLKHHSKPSIDTSNGSLSDLMANNASCCIPSLSLLSKQHQQHHHHSDSQSPAQRSVAEQHAALNLSRPMMLVRPHGHCATSSDVEGTTIIDSPCVTPTNSDSLRGSMMDAPQLVLENLASSFLVLVDARLRAYITILARHGVSFSECPGLSLEEQEEGVLAIERKLATLIEIGTSVVIQNMVTSFTALLHQEPKAVVDGKRTSLPIGMETTMDVFVPSSLSNKQTNVTFSSRATGTLSGSLDPESNLLIDVRMEIDTHELLSQLMHHAGQVMTIVVNNVKQVCTLPPHVPPAPPLPDTGSSSSSSSEAKGNKVPTKSVRFKHLQDLRVVSPDHNSSRKHPYVPPLDLDASAAGDDETDTSLLSPQSCANIVDFVIGEVNQDLIRPPKRAKLA
eukprot:CAMPEP_0116567832 /NCGR_PEP_ID=MMETSP0397-20121206/15245_1 /TAXON_ID=216820 /ORGANISM="Cyclophora tenuis, Strain ECT3854" /LENGTH=423 /DNA_ID=CAMNT_0004094905 /DNA_START=18 /DNA_END=1289 /DNA_ORIENTATION=+